MTTNSNAPAMVLPDSAVLHGWLMVASYLTGGDAHRGIGAGWDLHLRREARRRFPNAEIPPDWCPQCLGPTPRRDGATCGACDNSEVNP